MGVNMCNCTGSPWYSLSILSHDSHPKCFFQETKIIGFVIATYMVNIVDLVCKMNVAIETQNINVLHT